MQKIKSASIEMVSSIVTKSDGDLWPCAWGDDGFLYTANGDGKGFDLGSEWTDIVVNRISGDAMNLAGERLTGAEGVGGVFADPQRYNRKPTGMACAHGNLYLCVQNLNKVPGKGIFDDAPCCTICLPAIKGKRGSLIGISRCLATGSLRRFSLPTLAETTSTAQGAIYTLTVWITIGAPLSVAASQILTAFFWRAFFLNPLSEERNGNFTAV